jgi:hypothetical protein
MSPAVDIAAASFFKAPKKYKFQGSVVNITWL